MSCFLTTHIYIYEEPGFMPYFCNYTNICGKLGLSLTLLSIYLLTILDNKNTKKYVLLLTNKTHLESILTTSGYFIWILCLDTLSGYMYFMPGYSLCQRESRDPSYTAWPSSPFYQKQMSGKCWNMELFHSLYSLLSLLIKYILVLTNSWGNNSVVNFRNKINLNKENDVNDYKLG